MFLPQSKAGGACKQNCTSRLNDLKKPLFSAITGVSVTDVCFSLLLVFSLACFGAWGQLPVWEEELRGAPFIEPLPERLGEMIDIALGENPEIKIAEVELRAAAAQMRQTQLEVIEEVTNLYRERLRSQQALQALKPEEQEERIELQSKLAELDARARYVLGFGIGMPMPEEHAMENVPRRPAKRPEANQAQQACLDTVVTAHFEPMPLLELVERISELTGVAILSSLEINPEEMARYPRRENLSLSQVFNALADQHEYLCFVLRDYGVLLTHREAAMRMNAPAIPNDLPLFVPEIPMPPQEN